MFTIEQRIGRSESGGTVVARARFDPTGHATVLKAATRPGTRLVDEAELLLRLASQHWMPVVASGRTGPRLAEALGVPVGLPWYAMPPGQGTPLSAVDTPMPTPDWTRLAVALLRGLADGHAADVVHGDLKPANIWWDADTGVLTLADPQGPRGAGTEGWRCPAMEAGGPARAEGDVFVAGRVLLWARLGSAVRPSDDSPGHTQQLLEFWGVPPDVAAWLGQLTAVDPLARFPSAAAALAAAPFDVTAARPEPVRHPARIVLGARLPRPPEDAEPQSGPAEPGPPGTWTPIHLPAGAPAQALATLAAHPLLAEARARLGPEARRRSALMLGSPVHGLAPWLHLGWLVGRSDGAALHVHLDDGPPPDELRLWGALRAAARGRVRIAGLERRRRCTRGLSRWLQRTLCLTMQAAREMARLSGGEWRAAADGARRIFEEGGATWTTAGWLLDSSRLHTPASRADGAPPIGPAEAGPRSLAHLLALIGPRVPLRLAEDLARAAGFADPREALDALRHEGAIELGDAITVGPGRPAPRAPVSPAVRDAVLAAVPAAERAVRAAVLEWAGDTEGAARGFLEASEALGRSGRRADAVAAWTRAAGLVAQLPMAANARLHATLRVHELGLLSGGCMTSQAAGADLIQVRTTALLDEGQANQWPEIVVRALCVHAQGDGPRAAPPAPGDPAHPPNPRESPWMRLALVRQARMEAERLALRTQTIEAAAREAELWLDVGRGEDACAAARALVETREGPQQPGIPALRIALQLRVGAAMHEAGEYATALRLFGAARDRATALPDATALARACEALGTTTMQAGVRVGARHHWRQAYDLYTEMADVRAHAVALRLAALEAGAANPDAAERWAQRALNPALHELPPGPRRTARTDGPAETAPPGPALRLLVPADA